MIVYTLYIQEEASLHTKIQKWGNSLGLRIPKTIALEARVQEGSTVDLSLRDGELVIRPSEQPTYTLDELLEGVSKRNLHSEVESGRATGEEVW